MLIDKLLINQVVYSIPINRFLVSKNVLSLFVRLNITLFLPVYKASLFLHEYCYKL